MVNIVNDFNGVLKYNPAYFVFYLQVILKRKNVRKNRKERKGQKGLAGKRAKTGRKGSATENKESKTP